jgi:hypothetical protein
VTDETTGLMWQKGEGGKRNWNAAVQYATSLSLAGHSDWRLPSKVELLSLSRGLGEGAFNASRGKFEGLSGSRAESRKIYFPGMLSSEYWASNTYANNDTDAYYVDFSLGVYLGSSSYAYKTSDYCVRCVRLTPITDLEEELDPDIYGLRRFNERYKG